MNNRYVTRSSKSSVNETVERIRSFLESKNIAVFAHIDHGAAAKDVGMQLADEQVLIFGDPRVGTNLMQEDPSIGIELPLKILIWNDGGTKITYREPKTYLEEFAIIQNRPIIEKMSTLMAILVDAVSD